jgi:hypothetical protein
MEIKVGDWVRTPSGEVGTVEYIVRLTAYVKTMQDLHAHLISELTRLDGPPADSGSHT